MIISNSGANYAFLGTGSLGTSFTGGNLVMGRQLSGSICDVRFILIHFQFL